MAANVSIIRRLAAMLGPLLGLAVVYVIFGVADMLHADDPENALFFTWGTVQKILRDASLVGVAALGMTLVVISGGIDLSAGAAISLCATVTAWFFREEYGTVVALTAGLLTGCASGLLNGLLISGLRVVPFIATLGTMTIFFGLGLILSDDTPIRAFGKAPDWVLNLQTPYPIPDWLGVSSGVWVMFILSILTAIVLRFTVFGRRVIAIGSNEQAAHLCGVRVSRVRVLVYTLAGVFVGVAGLFQFAILNGEGDPKAGMGKELEIIAAVVIGGASLNGGRGSILGTLSGAIVMTTIINGCVTLEIPTSYQRVILGVIIIAAVTLDQWRQRRSGN